MRGPLPAVAGRARRPPARGHAAATLATEAWGLVQLLKAQAATLVLMRNAW